MNVLGLDLSLTKPGVAYADRADTLKSAGITGTARLAHWRAVFNALFEQHRFDVVVIEGYSFGSQGQSVVQIGELGGVVRLLMADAGVPYVELAPTKLKKYATGKGNAAKEAVTMAAVHRAGRTFPDNNAADAWWLMQMGLAHYAPNDARVVRMPVVNRGALVGVEWPKLQKVAQ